MSDSNEPLVTVVLPIYGVEAYLDTCVESVVGQTYRNLEIILVDDGGKDACPAMCDEWAKKDSRIKVVHKQNQGLGMARNSGIEASSGDYICFFDSDDFVDNGVIECAIEAAMRDGSDIVHFGLRSVSTDGKTVLGEMVPHCPKSVYEGDEVRDVFLPFLIAPDLKTGEDWGLMASACGCLIDSCMLSAWGFRFVSERDIISEDVYSMLMLYRNVRRVSVIERSFYNYRVNEASLTHAFKADRLTRIADFYRAARKLASECGYGEEVLSRLALPYWNFVISALKQLAGSDLPRAEKTEQIAALAHSSDFASARKALQGAKLSPGSKLLFEAVSFCAPAAVLALCRVRRVKG